MVLLGKKHLNVGNQQLGVWVSVKLSQELQSQNTSTVTLTLTNKHKQWWLSLVGSWMLGKNLEVHFPFLFMFSSATLDLQINFSFFSQLYHPHGCNTPQLPLCQHFQSILLQPFSIFVQALHSQFPVSTWLSLNQAQLYIKLKTKPDPWTHRKQHTCPLSALKPSQQNNKPKTPGQADFRETLQVFGSTADSTA